MVIDKVNEILEENAISYHKPVTVSYREILFPYLENHYFEKLGINIIFGKKVDNLAETLFLPLELHNVLSDLNYKEKPLVSKSTTIYEAKNTTFKASLLNSPFLIILFLLLIVIMNNKKVTSIYFTIISILGIFLCLVGFYSFHEEVLCNYNVLLFNPLLLPLVYSIHKYNPKTIINWGRINIITLIAHILLIINNVDLILFLPFIIAHFILISRIILRCKRNLKSRTIVL